VDFLTEATVLRDPVEVRHELHAEVDFRIDRRPTLPIGVACRRQLPDERQVKDAVDPTKEVVLGDE
jgi:hypothetical protein